jgi:hypothetical protein
MESIQRFPFDQKVNFRVFGCARVYKEDMFQLEEDLGNYRVVSFGEVVGNSEG